MNAHHLKSIPIFLLMTLSVASFAQTQDPPKTPENCFVKTFVEADAVEPARLYSIYQIFVRSDAGEAPFYDSKTGLTIWTRLERPSFTDGDPVAWTQFVANENVILQNLHGRIRELARQNICKAEF